MHINTCRYKSPVNYTSFSPMHYSDQCISIAGLQPTSPFYLYVWLGIRLSILVAPENCIPMHINTCRYKSPVEYTSFSPMHYSDQCLPIAGLQPTSPFYLYVWLGIRLSILVAPENCIPMHINTCRYKSPVDYTSFSPMHYSDQCISIAGLQPTSPFYLYVWLGIRLSILVAPENCIPMHINTCRYKSPVDYTSFSPMHYSDQCISIAGLQPTSPFYLYVWLGIRLSILVAPENCIPMHINTCRYKSPVNYTSFSPMHYSDQCISIAGLQPTSPFYLYVWLGIRLSILVAPENCIPMHINTCRYKSPVNYTSFSPMHYSDQCLPIAGLQPTSPFYLYVWLGIRLSILVAPENCIPMHINTCRYKSPVDYTSFSPMHYSDQCISIAGLQPTSPFYLYVWLGIRLSILVAPENCIPMHINTCRYKSPVEYTSFSPMHYSDQCISIAGLQPTSPFHLYVWLGIRLSILVAPENCIPMHINTCRYKSPVDYTSFSPMHYSDQCISIAGLQPTSPFYLYVWLGIRLSILVAPENCIPMHINTCRYKSPVEYTSFSPMHYSDQCISIAGLQPTSPFHLYVWLGIRLSILVAPENCIPMHINTCRYKSPVEYTSFSPMHYSDQCISIAGLQPTSPFHLYVWLGIRLSILVAPENCIPTHINTCRYKSPVDYTSFSPMHYSEQCISITGLQPTSLFYLYVWLGIRLSISVAHENCIPMHINTCRYKSPVEYTSFSPMHYSDQCISIAGLQSTSPFYLYVWLGIRLSLLVAP